MKKTTLIAGLVLLLLAMQLVSVSAATSPCKKEAKKFPGWFPGGYMIDVDGDCTYEIILGRIGHYQIIDTPYTVEMTCDKGCWKILNKRGTPTNEFERDVL